MKKAKKLKLEKETLLWLSSTAAAQVAGGGTDYTVCQGACTASAGCWTSGECDSWRVSCPEV